MAVTSIAFHLFIFSRCYSLDDGFFVTRSIQFILFSLFICLFKNKHYICFNNKQCSFCFNLSNMKAFELKIGKTNRGVYGIYAGVSRLAKFKTLEAAEKMLSSNRKTFEYWANSASVSIENTKEVIIWC